MIAKQIEKTGKTVSDAVQAALDELNVSIDDVLIEVLEEPEAGGILGIGRKPARVLVTLNSLVLDETAPVEAPESDDESAFAELSAAPEEEPFTEDEDDELIYYGDDVEPEYGDAQTKEEAAALDFLHRILQYFDMRETIETTWEEEHLRIDIDGENAGQIIGHRGETLNALQYLTSVAVNRVSDRHVRVLLDVAGYKARRSNSLRKTALRYAGEVVHLQKEFVMEPMNAAERRVVHFALQDFSGVTTESEGEEPNRCVVIIPTGEQ